MNARPEGHAKPQETDRQRLERSFAALAAHRHDTLLEAVATSAGELLRATDLDAALPGVLERIGRAAGADRIHVLEIDPAGAPRRGPVIAHGAWSAPGVSPPDIHKARTLLSEPVPGDWTARFARGETIAGPVRDFAPAARAFFETGGVKSLLAVPVFVEDRWWGLIGVEDCGGERDWLAAEIDVVKILAQLIGAAASRTHRPQAPDVSHALLSTAIECMPDAMLIVDENARIISFNRRFVDLWAIPRQLLDVRDDEPVLSLVASRMRDEADFLARVRFLYAHPEQEGHDELETKDGRIIDRHSVPLYGERRSYLGRIWFFCDISVRKAAEHRMAAQARTDAVTGLPNRVAFIERLRLAFARARRGDNPFAVLYLDLDRFKDVNDTLGHPAGDALLKAVAVRLRSCVRETDLVARFGGDEFAVLQDHMPNIAAVETLAAKICKTLAFPVSIDGNQIHATASVGVVPSHDEIDDPEVMMTKADLALYRAKHEGRNRFRFHVDELDRKMHERVAIGEDLHLAIARRELQLWYQPQIELASGRLVGLEALIRWNHPTRGLLLPADFIPIAESSGNIFHIGQWVVEEACRQIRSWQHHGIVAPRVAANVSAGQFRLADDLDRVIADALARYGIAPDRLELELTEAALMETTQRHSVGIARLRRVGVRIAIDDFGTGYSSFDSLRADRIARLKIDPRFVRNIATNDDDATLVRAIIRLAQELGIEVIAEGVETAEQKAVLMSAGCRFAQGYHLARPMSVERTTEWMRRIAPVAPGGDGEPARRRGHRRRPQPRVAG